MDIAQKMVKTLFNDNPDLLKKVITADKSWMYSYGYDIETKAHISQWSQDRKKPVKFYQM